MTISRSDITIFGVLNVTEDSFSDGGRFLDPTKAIQEGLRLVAEGADVVDVGAASSHPEAVAVSAAEEIARLAPVVKELSASAVALSIDSWRTEVQRWALAQPVAWLNDIRGFVDPSFYAELADSDCGLIAMHSLAGGTRAVRETFSPTTVLARIDAWFAERLNTLEQAGVTRDRIVLDPGMGLFLGSNEQASIAVLRNYRHWCELFDTQLMVAVSRKSIIGRLTGKPVGGRLAGGLAAELFAIDTGARAVRTHEPGALADALTVRDALTGSPETDG
ncbi:MAG: dihydropteroate synthase [Hyphomicrobiaceae bacterium]|jgi:dihydropteroate synthase